jgi:LAS superfamily LD-carboxypeptidase LdcB
VVDEINAMIAAAASDGTTLTIGNSYRDPQEQIDLRRQHCGTTHYAIYEMRAGDCHPPTAKPGHSQHEKGLAIDFANCSSRSTACYVWLAGHAKGFGFYNLPSEAWHWSTTGS